MRHLRAGGAARGEGEREREGEGEGEGATASRLRAGGATCGGEGTAICSPLVTGQV